MDGLLIRLKFALKIASQRALPVYESVDGDEYNYHNESSGPSGYTQLTLDPVFWVLKDQVPGRSGTTGVNVELVTNRAAGFSNDEDNPPIKTTNKQGQGTGQWVYNEGGARFWPKKNVGLGNGNAVQRRHCTAHH